MFCAIVSLVRVEVLASREYGSAKGRLGRRSVVDGGAVRCG